MLFKYNYAAVVDGTIIRGSFEASSILEADAIARSTWESKGYKCYVSAGYITQKGLERLGYLTVAK